ncbi:MAG TPA: hypothetical protein VNE86_04930 [Nitrososphaerales archaeon]|nr:hypothetical protein [Nitrososphaerales archaeon]
MTIQLQNSLNGNWIQSLTSRARSTTMEMINVSGGFNDVGAITNEDDASITVEKGGHQAEPRNSIPRQV